MTNSPIQLQPAWQAGGNLLKNKWINRFLRSRWYPAIIQWPTLMIFGFIMLLILNRYSHFLILPGLLLLITVLFYSVAFLTHTPVASLSGQGWLLGPFMSKNLLPDLPLDLLSLDLCYFAGSAVHARYFPRPRLSRSQAAPPLPSW